MTARYIAIDWGPTDLRTWLYQGGRRLDSGRSETSVTRLNRKSPAVVLAEITTGWREENALVVMTGMVGGSVGWKVTPYLFVPTCFSSIGGQLASAGDDIQIIPRLCVSYDDSHNMMHGEGTQLIGACTLAPSSLRVMPNTHCKWVQADSQQANDLRTVMTSKLYHLLLDYSLTGADLPLQENAVDAFMADPECGLNTPDILPQLSEAHASHVLGTLPHEQVSEFLSGLLISAEVASMRNYVTHQRIITLVAGTSLTVRYQQAFQAMGCGVTAVMGDMAFQTGIRNITRAVAS